LPHEGTIVDVSKMSCASDKNAEGAQTTVSTESGICHTVTATCRYRGRVGTGLSVLWVAYAPDDGWWYHPYVEQFPDKINCVTLHLIGYIL
jgi:hypothetical protein